MSAQLLAFTHAVYICWENTLKYSILFKMYTPQSNFVYTETRSNFGTYNRYKNDFVHVPFSSSLTESRNSLFNEERCLIIQNLNLSSYSSTTMQETGSSALQNLLYGDNSKFYTQHVPSLEQPCDLNQRDVSDRFGLFGEKPKLNCHRYDKQDTDSSFCEFKTKTCPCVPDCYIKPDYNESDRCDGIYGVEVNSSKFLDTSFFFNLSCGELNNQQLPQRSSGAPSQFPLTRQPSFHSNFQTKGCTQNPIRLDKLQLENQNLCRSLKNSHTDLLASGRRCKCLQNSAVFSSSSVTLSACENKFYLQDTQNFGRNLRNIPGKHGVKRLIKPYVLDSDKVRGNPCFSSLDPTKPTDSDSELSVALEHLENTGLNTISEDQGVETSTASSNQSDLSTPSISHTLQHPTSFTTHYSHSTYGASPTPCLTSIHRPKTTDNSFCTTSSKTLLSSNSLYETSAINKANVDSSTNPAVKRGRSPVLTSTATGRVKRIRRHVPHAMRTPAAVDKRNSRERRRIGGVNHAFEILRQHTPTLSHLERASKISILRQAQAYIRELSAILARKKVYL